MNLYVVKVIEKVPEIGNNFYWRTAEQDWFDSDRYSSDKHFITETEFEYLRDSYNDQCFYRPKNFESSKKWIIQNVDYPERIIDVLVKMEQDKSLYFEYV